jgi:hypothetical protein
LAVVDLRITNKEITYYIRNHEASTTELRTRTARE